MARIEEIEELEIREELMVRNCVRSSAYWLMNGTATEDEQDRQGNPIKPFPNREYFPAILDLIDSGPIVYLEKSRTMMMTWLSAGWAAHEGFTKPHTGVVFHSKDEDRAVHCVHCIKVLWRESHPHLKDTWKLRRPYEKQPYNKFELANGSRFLAIVGDPDKIRYAHPTYVVIDEGAFLEDFHASFDTAAATRCLKIIALSSASPGGFYETIKDARPAEWPNWERWKSTAKPKRDEGRDVLIPSWGNKYVDKVWAPGWSPSPKEPIRGLRLRRTESGAPVVYLHYHADPSMTERRVRQEISRYTSEARWRQEMEIDYEALSGVLVYPEFDEAAHVVPDSEIPSRLCRYMSIDPHPRTPHAFLWIGIDQWNDWWVWKELWPSVVYGQSRTLRDDEVDNSYTIKEYAETLAFLEGNRLEMNRVGFDDEYAIYRERPSGKKIITRFMDQAGKAFRASGEQQEEETYAKRYARYGIQCMDPKKSHESGEDAIRELLKPRKSDGRVWPRLHISRSCVEIIWEFKNHRYQTMRANEERDLRQRPAEARCHLLDNLRYLATSRASWFSGLVS